MGICNSIAARKPSADDVANGRSPNRQSGAFPRSPSPRKGNPNTDEGEGGGDAGSPPLTAASSPEAVESPPMKEHEGHNWVGIGFDGEAISLSVCSESIDSEVVSLAISSPIHGGRPMSKATDFQIFEGDNLQIVEEDETSIANADSFLRSHSVAKRGMQDVEELTGGPSVLEDVKSTTSTMTKDDALDFSQCLGQRRDGKVDAIQALAKVAYHQEKQLEWLRQRTREQERKISTLTDLCQRLARREREGEAAQAATPQKRDARRDAGAASTRERQQSAARRKDATAERAAATLGPAEEGNGETSRRLQYSNSHARSPPEQEKSSAIDAQYWKVKYKRLREEGRRRAEEDRTALKTVALKMTAMAEARRQSESKVEILMEMKAAMEEQTCLLEENGDCSTK